MDAVIEKERKEGLVVAVVVRSVPRVSPVLVWLKDQKVKEYQLRYSVIFEWQARVWESQPGQRASREVIEPKATASLSSSLQALGRLTKDSLT